MVMVLQTIYMDICNLGGHLPLSFQLEVRKNTNQASYCKYSLNCISYELRSLVRASVLRWPLNANFHRLYVFNVCVRL